MGTVTFDVSVGDNGRHVATKTFTVTIAPPGPPSITTATLPGGSVTWPTRSLWPPPAGSLPYNWGSLSLRHAAARIDDHLRRRHSGRSDHGGQLHILPASHRQHGDQCHPAIVDRHQQHRILHNYRIASARCVPQLPYSQQLAASGGSGNYGWQLNSGALPTGSSLSSGGLISGTPTQGGSFTFTIRAVDLAVTSSRYSKRRRSSRLSVNAGPIITTRPFLPGRR